MKIIIAFLFLLLQLFAFELQKPKTYNGTQAIDNWLMSEKLDGIRAYWNGQELLTRQGNTIHVPKWFTLNFPPFELDGELWIKRGAFSELQSIVMDHFPSQAWGKVSYNIFEVPHAKGDFTTRLKKAQMWFLENGNAHVKIIPQKLCKNKEELQLYLKEIIAQGGEGVIVKNPELPYFSGRSANVLKVKEYKDMEGVVVAIDYAANRMKSLIVELKNGVVFKLGSGFSKTLRKNPPKVGSIVTFKYYGLTKNNKPRFASFLHVRYE